MGPEQGRPLGGFYEGLGEKQPGLERGQEGMSCAKLPKCQIGHTSS